MGNLRFPAIFRNKQFLRLWGNQLVLQVSFNMCNYTALLILADRTHSPFAQAQFYAALTLPAFVFGIVAGPTVDMFDKKKVMIVTNFLLIFLFLLYIFADARIIFIMLIAFFTSAVARFFIPAEAAAIPRLVSKESLEHANTFFILTLLGSVLLGYAIAGPIIQLFGGLGTVGEIAPFIIGSVFLIIALLFLLSLKRIPPVELEVKRGSLFKKTLILFFDTFKEVRNKRSISVPLGLLVFVEFIVGMMSILLLEYVRLYLNLPLTSVSYVLIGPLVLGLIFGIFAISKVDRLLGHIKSIIAACFGVGLILFLLGFVPVLASPIVARFFTMAAAFLMGISVVIITVHARTLLQLNARVEMHGRIFSLLDILIAIVIPVPVLILGFLADKLSILMILAAVGVLTILAAFLSNEKMRRSHARTP